MENIAVNGVRRFAFSHPTTHALRVKLDALVLVPMFPHTLSSRPIVIDGQSEIKIVIGEENELHPQIICDGQMHMSAAPGDSISIHKKPHALKLIHPMGHDYYHVCRTKLGWGTKLGE